MEYKNYNKHNLKEKSDWELYEDAVKIKEDKLYIVLVKKDDVTKFQTVFLKKDDYPELMPVEAMPIPDDWEITNALPTKEGDKKAYWTMGKKVERKSYPKTKAPIGLPTWPLPKVGQFVILTGSKTSWKVVYTTTDVLIVTSKELVYDYINDVSLAPVKIVSWGDYVTTEK